MRLVYMDEAGTGSAAENRYVVVAGVLVDADKQWRLLEAHLQKLVDEYVLPEDQKSFIFHATDIHSGNKSMPKARYGRAMRIELLRNLCLIPSKFNLPVVAAYVEREAYKQKFPALSEGERIVNMQAIAAVSCTCAVEKALRHEASSDEVAVLVYENNDQTRAAIRWCHSFLRTPEALADATAEGWALESVLPFTKVIDSAHFAGKHEAPILQVADALAFAIARQLNGRDDERYADPIGQNLIMRLRGFAS